jgi:hypothetical protein
MVLLLSMAFRGFGEMGLKVYENTIGKTEGIVNLDPYRGIAGTKEARFRIPM